MLSLVAYLVRQAPIQNLVRVDKNILLSAFSMRSGNERIGADQWEMGPGWTGEDTRVGKEYIEDFSKLSDKEWIQLWNSDTFSDTLFGNEAVPAQKAEWAEYRKKAMSVLPICHATNELIDIDEPHHHNYRRMIRASATRAARRDSGKGGGAKGKKKPGKSAPKPEKKKGKGKDGKDREGDGKDVGGNEAGSTGQQEKRIATADKEKDGEQMGQVQEVTLSVFSPPLLTKDLNQSSLQNELDDVNLVLESYTDSLSLPPLVSSFGGLIQYHNSLLAVESHFDLRSRITQQDLLLLKVIIWGKLSLWKADACSFLHDHRGSPAGDLFWFNRLALDIYQWVCVRLQDKEFVPRNYLPQGVSIVDTKPCHLRCFPARIPTDSVEFSVTKAEEWVLGWIGLKGGEKAYVSAFFVYSMVQWLGAPVLAVSRIWKTAQNIPALLLGKTRWSRVSQEEVSAAVVELKKVMKQDTVTPLLVELQKSFFRGRGESDRERHCGYSRNIHQAIAYWNAVNKSEYNGWLLARDSFRNRSGNLLLSVVRLLSGKEFPGMGKLSAFQVAVDYMKAGALVATQREFVETLMFVNAGAIKRLTEWEYLSSKVGSPKRDLEEVESAFAKVMQDLKQRWDQKRGTRGRGIDMIDVEHWLCKASRKRLGRSSYNAIYK
ncbi:hypothetical protein F5890DRAFT_1479023 [Lentinula detonsa]|uniref:Uncharacterized protein n=1 Tax=Lentinula detonsa TaxID=2804962 RepID=A0AA38PNF9_9AGAR|nr:hypothetical protein F5890DRAFT_1479023 [Lentinula detonsa]